MKTSMKGYLLIFLAILFSLAGVYLMNVNLKGYSIFSVSVALVLLFMGITYIFGNLIGSSASTVEVKCFMSECQNKTLLHFNDTHIQNKVQDVMKEVWSNPKNTVDEKESYFNQSRLERE